MVTFTAVLMLIVSMIQMIIKLVLNVNSWLIVMMMVMITAHGFICNHDDGRSGTVGNVTYILTCRKWHRKRELFKLLSSQRLPARGQIEGDVYLVTILLLPTNVFPCLSAELPLSAAILESIIRNKIIVDNCIQVPSIVVVNRKGE